MYVILGFCTDHMLYQVPYEHYLNSPQFSFLADPD